MNPPFVGIKLKKTFRIFIILGMLGCCISFVLFIIFRYLHVEEIQFIGEGMKANINDRLLSKNLLFFPSHTVRQSLLSQYPQFKNVIVEKHFPHTIVIKPIVRAPYAYLEVRSMLYGIDEDGIVLSVGESEKILPIIAVPVEEVHIGGKVADKRVLVALQFLVEMTAKIPIKTILTSEDGSYLIAKSETSDIFFSQNSHIVGLSATLQTIIGGVRIKGTMPKAIDLRFSKPVVKW